MIIARQRIVKTYSRGNEYSLTHWAEPFLRSCKLCSHSRTSQHFMEHGSSLPCGNEYTDNYRIIAVSVQRQRKHISITIEGLLGDGLLNVFSVRVPCPGVVLKISGVTVQLRWEFGPGDSSRIANLRKRINVGELGPRRLHRDFTWSFVW
jgi:hypothetical protein